jgi:hypothetical protein
MSFRALGARVVAAMAGAVAVVLTHASVSAAQMPGPGTVEDNGAGAAAGGTIGLVMFLVASAIVVVGAGVLFLRNRRRGQP